MDEINDLLIRLAASLKPEDLTDNPELEEQLRQLVGNMSESNDLPDEAIQQLSIIKDKTDRFMAAMQLLQVKPDPKVMAKLAEAMQNAGLLNDGEILSEPPKEEDQNEDPEAGPEEDDFLEQMGHQGKPAEDVPMSEQEAMEPEYKDRE